MSFRDAWAGHPDTDRAWRDELAPAPAWTPAPEPAELLERVVADLARAKGLTVATVRLSYGMTP